MLRVLVALALVFTPVTYGSVLRVAAGAAGAGDGSSWADAYPHLRDALTVAVAGDEIWVAAGVYYPDEQAGMPDGTASDSFRMKPLVPMYGGFSGTETLVDQRDPERNPTILSGDIDQDDLNSDGNRIAETSADIVGTNSTTVVRFFGYLNAGAALLDGFTITAASASASVNGGGLLVNSRPFTASRCRFLGNKAGGGGGAWIQSNQAVFSDCSFSGNFATSTGGALEDYGGITLSRCVFTHNEAGVSGGAEYSFSGGKDIMVDCHFEGNHAGSKGGACYYSSNDNKIQRTTFVGNSSVSGGAVQFFNDSGNEVSDCLFQSNSAQQDGGALYSTGSDLDIARCKFCGNSAGGDGGAVCNYSGGEVVNSLFQSNAAVKFGGAWLSSGDTQMRLCTLSGNSAAFGGAIYGQSRIDVSNSIVWRNLARSAQFPLDNSIANSVVCSDCILEGVIGSTPGPSNLRKVDPLFLVPADPALAPVISGNLQLGKDSPALDTGNLGVFYVATDLVGAPRVTDGTVDLGAYEGQNDQFDTDGDGMSDAFELAATTPPSRTGLAADDDPDGDGLSNRLEFAFGLNPLMADAHKAVTPLMTETAGERYLALRYRRNAWALQFESVDVEHSLDLGSADPWATGETANVGVVSLDGNAEEVTVRSLLPVGSQRADFLRVRVEKKLP